MSIKKKLKFILSDSAFTLTEVLVTIGIGSIILATISSQLFFQLKEQNAIDTTELNFSAVTQAVEQFRKDVKLATSITATSTPNPATDLIIQYLNSSNQISGSYGVHYELFPDICVSFGIQVPCKRLDRVDRRTNSTVSFRQILNMTWCIDGAAGCPSVGKPAETSLPASKRLIGQFTFLRVSAHSSDQTLKIDFVVELENFPSPGNAAGVTVIKKF